MSANILTSLNAATAIGPGASKIFTELQTIGVLQASVTGAPSSWEVTFEVSLDGVNWTAVNGVNGPAATVTNGICTLDPGGQQGMAVLAVRANLIILIGGTSPKVTAVIATRK